MATDIHHAISSAKRWGGRPEDYLALHKWFDCTKASWADVRHRAMRHHAEGIAWCVEHFGDTIVTSEGRLVATRVIAEQHVREDCGWIPSMKDWLGELPVQKWMGRQVQPLYRELSDECDAYAKTLQERS